MSTTLPTLPAVTDNPYTVPEMCARIVRVRAESEEYWNAYSTAQFFASMGSAWSAADHVRHLTKSIRPVANAFRLPRFALQVLFGRSRAPSRSFDQLRSDYLAMLSARERTPGGLAGRFTPGALDPTARNEPTRQRIMRYHALAVESLLANAGKISEPVADRYRIPHPLLGKLTLREMLGFTLYHNLHHVHVAERRRNEMGKSSAP